MIFFFIPCPWSHRQLRDPRCDRCLFLDRNLKIVSKSLILQVRKPSLRHVGSLVWSQTVVNQGQHHHIAPKAISYPNHMDVIYHLELCWVPQNNQMQFSRCSHLATYRAVICIIPLCPGIREALLPAKGGHWGRGRWSVCAAYVAELIDVSQFVTCAHLAK